ncbi:class E sortase [Aeromicrobium massiliense]|uniref:class E sortase n=1 Tax=Aeromicrobium massiliense TaxID=1464554 RepID=UPI000A9A91F0|nr:class E sortase [Aeromicrobium massiliense]
MLRIVGLVLVVAGLSVLGWLGWQYWGTNWQSQQRHDDVTETLEKTWTSGQATAETDFGEATAILRIPRFGDDWSVPVLNGDSAEVLASGVGHLDGTADPGERGNLALAGHRVTHGEPFAGIRGLRPGDEVTVETRDAVHTYVLDTSGQDLDVPFTDTWVVSERPRNPDGGTGPVDAPALLTLVTCAEVFHTDDRTVVFGHLVKSEPRVAPAAG